MNVGVPPAAAKNVDQYQRVTKDYGGGRGIRTLETVSRLHTFQACAFNHSATPPSPPGHPRRPGEAAALYGSAGSAQALPPRGVKSRRCEAASVGGAGRRGRRRHLIRNKATIRRAWHPATEDADGRGYEIESRCSRPVPPHAAMPQGTPQVTRMRSQQAQLLRVRGDERPASVPSWRAPPACHTPDDAQ